jgi:uncharacterized membrane protein YjgN (DUF898 family)
VSQPSDGQANVSGYAPTYSGSLDGNPSGMRTFGATSVPLVGSVHAQAAPVFSWDGPTWRLAGLGLLNFCLNFITLGIYGFWGRTEVRKRVWSSVHLNGEPLAYTGTGKELFVGFLIVFGFVLVPTLALSLIGVVVFGPSSAGYTVLQIAMGMTFLFLGGVASYRARRYRLSRTAWRGIRGSLEGSSWTYGWASFWLTLLVPFIAAVLAGVLYLANFGFGPPKLDNQISQQAFFYRNGGWLAALYAFFILGSLFIVPWRTTKLTRHMTNDMAFGSAPFTFNGTARALYARFIARWAGVAVLFVATPVAIYAWIGQARFAAMVTANQTGLPFKLTGREIAGVLALLFIASMLYSVLSAWYKARELNYFAASTRYGGEPFKLNVTARGLIWLVVTNAPLTLFSLGILRPVAQARTAKYIVENLALDGPIDFAAIAQSAAARSKTGEGLAQAFDVDAF